MKLEVRKKETTIITYKHCLGIGKQHNYKKYGNEAIHRKY